MKTRLRGLRYSLRKTRAYNSWRNAHLLRFSGIQTPRPVAFLEKRWGPFRLGSYFICAFSDFPTAAEKYRSQPPTGQELTWFAELFEKIRASRIYHGDSNAHNFLVTDKSIMIIDVDRMRAFSSKLFDTFLPQIFQSKHDKDRRRFLHDWRDQPDMLKLFSEILSPNQKERRNRAPDE